MSKHTPGPWHLEHHEVHAGDGCEFIAYFDPRAETGRANARLIAAAPEMFEALRWVLPSHGDCEWCRRVGTLCVGHAALAKARGES